MRAICRQSGQLADQRSGTLVAERPDEQFAPNMPIFSVFVLYIAARSRIEAGRSSIVDLFPNVCRTASRRSRTLGARRPVTFAAAGRLEPAGRLWNPADLQQSKNDRGA